LLNVLDPELESSAWFQPLNLKCDFLGFKPLLSNAACTATPRWDEDNEYRWAFKEYEVDKETAVRAVAAARGRDLRRAEYMQNVKDVLALTRKLSVDLRDVVVGLLKLKSVAP
jgi:hypothetical protein